MDFSKFRFPDEVTEEGVRLASLDFSKFRFPDEVTDKPIVNRAGEVYSRFASHVLISEIEKICDPTKSSCMQLFIRKSKDASFTPTLTPTKVKSSHDSFSPLPFSFEHYTQTICGNDTKVLMIV